MLRCLPKFLHRSRPFYRGISNMPIDDQKITNKQDTKEFANTRIKDDTKTYRFYDYGNLLPDRKGDIKVCIIGGGAASLYATILLKQSRIIKCIHLIDPTNSLAGAVLDMNHVDTSTRIKYFKKKNLKEGLKEMNIIALMDEMDTLTIDEDPRNQFKAASNYVLEMTEQMVQFSPDSLVAVSVKPVTATLAMVSEIYKCAGWWDPDRIVGSTAFDSMRMEAITANLLDLNPEFLSVPMVGGADPNIIVPLLSCARPVNRFTNAQQNTLVQSLRSADKEMACIESRGPTLSAGAAAAKLILTLAGGLSGFENVVACAFVRSNVLPTCRFFTSELQFGTAGVLKNFGLPKISSSEILLVEHAIPIINEYVQMAINVVHGDRLRKVRSS